MSKKRKINFTIQVYILKVSVLIGRKNKHYNSYESKFKSPLSYFLWRDR